MSTNGNFLSSPKGKKIMNYAYGIGASIVIIGALFKILHWPGAPLMLTLGMGTEALLFFLGAFDAPHEEATRWDWTSVYPNIVPEKSAFDSSSSAKPAMSTSFAQSSAVNSGVAASSSMSGLSQSDVAAWNDNMKNMSVAISGLSKMADSAKVSEEYVSKLSNASNAVEKLSKAQEATADILTSGAEKFNSTMTTAANKFDGINNVLSDSYNQVAQALNVKLNAIKDSTSQTENALENVSKNLSAINAVYELQLSSANNELKIKEAQLALHSDLNAKLSNIRESVSNAAVANFNYKKESEMLNNNIAELNRVYGNMLSSFNS